MCIAEMDLQNTYNNCNETLSEDAGNNYDDSLRVYEGFTITMLIIGLTCNLFILLAFALYKKLRSLGFAYILNGAIADILVVLLSDTMIVVGIKTDGAIFTSNPIFCHFTSFLCLSMCACSIWSNSLGGLHAYIRICHPWRHFLLCNRRLVAISISFVWIWSILILLPSLFGWGGHHYDNNHKYCILDSQSTSYIIFFLVSGYFLPLSINAYCFGRIAYLSLQTSRRFARKFRTRVGVVQVTNTLDPKRKLIPSRLPLTESDRRLVRSFLFIFLYLFSSWIMLIVVWLSRRCKEMEFQSDSCLQFSRIALSAAHTHCSINGLLFAASNKEFRNVFVKMITFKCFHKL